jgi:hypothetical protein
MCIPDTLDFGTDPDPRMMVSVHKNNGCGSDLCLSGYNKDMYRYYLFSKQTKWSNIKIQLTFLVVY